ncbi:MAG: flavodoxin-dependent (E)-4-hydroxy-3-methylbut-2-enyl-diphosphate synthase, partial [Eubacteriales bacterium]|nr:flavodoxin-dependent (E)-4-hydroxy-3-methylbut-2-enyl-diphosphate synthase [Eubacteriales bacterium]
LVIELEKEIVPLCEKRKKAGKKSLDIAVMGCEVNGPGEAKEADFGVACGKGKGLIFIRGKAIKTVPEEEIIKELVRMAENYENI